MIGVDDNVIKSGIVSVTFRKKSPREVVDITTRAGLSAIEWGSDIHVRPGDCALAREVRDMTVSKGLEISSYGSYYYLGMDKEEFSPYLETALALGAPNIRVWAGQTASQDADSAHWEHTVADAQKICAQAAKEGLRISVEYHAHSLTDTIDSALRLLDLVGADNFYSYWQQPLTVAPENQLPEMLRLHASGKMSNIHVYCQYAGEPQRPLADGLDAWRSYFHALAEDDTLRYAMIEFVKDGADEMFLADSATLLSLLHA